MFPIAISPWLSMGRAACIIVDARRAGSIAAGGGGEGVGSGGGDSCLVKLISIKISNLED